VKLSDKLIEGTILVPVHATCKESANQELLTHLQSLGILSDTINLFANIKEQEIAFTSSAGRGVAYPHSTSIEIDELTCVLGISKEGIDYDSLDGQDCHLILLTLSPKDKPTIHRKYITRFRSMVQNPDVRSNLYESKSSDEILKIISIWEENENREDDVI